MPQLAIVLERTPLKVLDLDHPVIRIGRDPEMDVVIDDLSVSRRQAELRQEGSRWKIRDLSSTNGTFLNGARLTGVDALKSGDEITFGRFSVFFDHVPAEPIRVEDSFQTGPSHTDGTLVLDPDEAVKLKQIVLEKRQAQLLWELNGRQGTHSLKAGTALVGRTDLCDLRMTGRGPSQHLLFVRKGHLFEVRNLSRWYRMRVNGEPITRGRLRNGDRIEVGAFRLTFLDQVG